MDSSDLGQYYLKKTTLSGKKKTLLYLCSKTRCLSGPRVYIHLTIFDPNLVIHSWTLQPSKHLVFFLFQPMILKTRMCYTLFVKGQRRTKNICSRLSMATWRIPSPCRWCRLLSKKQLLSRQSQGEPAMKKSQSSRFQNICVSSRSLWLQRDRFRKPSHCCFKLLFNISLPKNIHLYVPKRIRSDQRRVDKPGRG